MYRAKRNGRNRLAVYDAALDAAPYSDFAGDSADRQLTPLDFERATFARTTVAP